MAKLAAVLGALCFFGLGFAAEPKPRVGEALKNIRVLLVPQSGRDVDRTVAEALRRDLGVQVVIKTTASGGASEKGVFRIGVFDEKIAAGPSLDALRAAGGKSWMFLKLAPDGSGELTTSAPHLLYALFSLLNEDWLGLDAAGFENGKVVVPRFSRLEGGDNYLANPKRGAAGTGA